MLCNKITLNLKQGANPSILNAMLITLRGMDDHLFKSYSYRNKKLYLTLGYRSEKCKDIKQALMDVYNNYYTTKVLN